jgi:hypothetical protein
MDPGKPFPDVLYDLESFSRGLPKLIMLQTHGVMAVFRELLLTGSIERNKVDDDVEYCHRHGWIQSDFIHPTVYYTFPSPLHATYISWQLIPREIDCPFADVRDMTFSILKKFVPSQLSAPTHIGCEFTERPLEARYAYEFYRGLFEATHGGVRICPELLSKSGAPDGRIDFFIPGQKWGLELTREGNGLAEHSSRFRLGGKYGVWLTSNDMVDYIILDCRVKKPRDPHPSKLILCAKGHSKMTSNHPRY